MQEGSWENRRKNVELSQVKLKPFISWRKEKENNWLDGYWVEKSVDLLTLHFRLNSFREKSALSLKTEEIPGTFFQ